MRNKKKKIEKGK